MKKILRRLKSLCQLPPLAVLCLVSTALSSCASSGLVNMWRDPSFQASPMRNMLVIAAKKNPVHRRMWEDGFTAELGKHGIAATPSYRLFPDALPDTQAVVAAVRDSSYDGVLVTTKLPTERNVRYVPGYSTVEPVLRPRGWRGAYYTYYQRVYYPGYVETETIIRYQTDVWTTEGDGRLIWSGTTESIDPGSSRAINREITKLIVPELQRQGILPPKKKG